ncbi:tolloid-like protein 2 [Microplitis mediator]|uniref:tolloid-like protein 2 n=1 Tax=Microplitis mediator TaxID=375433 RepID=UPI002555D3E7|nr:tolloid-like protein 2 [Microplitis mediator]
MTTVNKIEFRKTVECKGELEVIDEISEFGKNQTTNKDRRSHAVKTKDRLWDGGIIPYEIDKVFTLAQYQLIRQAMQLWERSTCIQFVPRIEGVHKDYTLITKEYCGCCSVVGKNSDEEQFISLHDECMDRYTLLHELGHTIGLYHEHTRSDRDEYVNIFRANIMSGVESQFEKISENDSTTLGQPYDYRSIMHYPETAAAKDSSSDTINPSRIINGEWPVLGGDDLSRGDVVTTNLLYRCPECGGTFSNPKGTFSPPIELMYSQPNLTRCEWTIRAPEGHRIKLLITVLSIPESSGCSTDYLEIRYNRESNDVIANTNILKIVLVYTQYNESPVDFIIEYEAMCGKNFYVGTNETFYLQSPNYPGPYVANKECYWYITAPEHYSISLDFHHFDIEESTDCNKYDYLEVRDGDNYRAPLIGTYCGKHDNLTISSIGRFMFLRFIPDESLNRNGFSTAITARKMKMH